MKHIEIEINSIQKLELNITLELAKNWKIEKMNLKYRTMGKKGIGRRESIEKKYSYIFRIDPSILKFYRLFGTFLAALW